jgi:hypothetical protein
MFLKGNKSKDADVKRGAALLPTLTNIYTPVLKETCTNVLNIKESLYDLREQCEWE